MRLRLSFRGALLTLACLAAVNFLIFSLLSLPEPPLSVTDDEADKANFDSFLKGVKKDPVNPSERPTSVKVNTASEKPDKVAADRSYVSICTVVRDEAVAVLEWILFHRAVIGVQQFFLYDHDSRDDSLEEVLQPLVVNGTVVIVDWSHCDAKMKGDWEFDISAAGKRGSDGSLTDREEVTNCQLDAFAHYLAHYGIQSHWTMFIDVDEYVFVSNKSETRSFVEILESYEEYHSVGLTSVSFGTSHHVWQPPGFTVSNYQLRTALLFGQVRQQEGKAVTEDEYYEEMFKVKSVVKSGWARPGLCGSHLFSDSRSADPKAVSTVLTDRILLRGCGDASHDPVHCLKKGCSVMMPSLEPIRLHHYRTQSLENYLEKISKGVVQGSLENKRRSSPFCLINRNEVRDGSVVSKILPLKSAMLSYVFSRAQASVPLVVVTGPPLSGVPFVSAVLGLAGAHLGHPSLYAKCGDADTVQCSPYLYPLGFWAHHRLSALHSLIFGPNNQTIGDLVTFNQNLPWPLPQSAALDREFQEVFNSVRSAGSFSLLQDPLFCFAPSTWAYLVKRTAGVGNAVLVIPYLHPLEYAEALNTRLYIPEKIALSVWEACYYNLLQGFSDDSLKAAFRFRPSSFERDYRCVIRAVNARRETWQSGRNGKAATESNTSGPLMSPSPRRVREMLRHHFPNKSEQEWPGARDAKVLSRSQLKIFETLENMDLLNTCT